MGTTFSKHALDYLVSQMMDMAAKQEYNEDLIDLAHSMERFATPSELHIVKESLYEELKAYEHFDRSDRLDLLEFLGVAIGTTTNLWEMTRHAIETIDDESSLSVENAKQPKIQTYLVPVSWEMGSELRIKASSFEEAFNIAEEHELPIDGEYIDSSYKVSTEYTIEEPEEEENE